MDTDKEAFCIIIGAMKCGTSTLFDMLADHPEVIPSRAKEPGFFSFPRVYEKGFEWYKGLWEYPEKRKATFRLLLEASTHYTKDPDIPSGALLMSKHLSDVALIYVIRDPIHRIESQADFDLMRGRLISRVDYTDEHFLTVTRYMHQLRPYIERYGLQRILVLNFSDLISRNAETMQRVARFVGIDPSKFSNSELQHKNRTPARVTKYSQVLRWASYHRKPRLLKIFLRVFAMPLSLVTLKRARMTDDDKKNVLDALSSDIRAFRDCFGWYPMSEETARIAEKCAALDGDSAALHPRH